MEEQINIVTSDETSTDKATELAGEISAGASAESAARRIRAKRIIKRRKRLLRFQQGMLVVAVVFALGVTGYAISELGIAKNSRHTVKAKTDAMQLAANKHIYNCFGTVGSTGLKLSLPAKLGNVIGVGFHQAERKEAYPIVPSAACFDTNETSATVRDAISNSKVPVLFVMSSRGRGSALTSAMDIALQPDSDVYSPVDGVVAQVTTYDLYGRLTDYHVEIQPDGYPDLRVAIIHIENVQVAVGQRATRQKTIIGRMRALPEISSQILKYLPQRADHVHIQVNPATIEDKSGS